MDIEHYPDGNIPTHLLDWVWEVGPVLAPLVKYRNSGAAILRDGGGTELLLVERPWDGQYLVATLLPSPDHLHVTGAGPRTVAAPTAHAVASEVRSRLLPEFEQLVNLARLREVQEHLNWLRDDVEPGTVPYPYPADLDAALERFLTHAPYLIAASRRAGAKPLAAQDAKVLDRFETLLASLTQSSEDAGSGLEPGGTDEAMAVWLEVRRGPGRGGPHHHRRFVPGTLPPHRLDQHAAETAGGCCRHRADPLTAHHCRLAEATARGASTPPRSRRTPGTHRTTPGNKEMDPHMAVRTTWNIVHSCGHEISHNLSNRPADRRAGFARWLQGRDCTDCWKAARDEDSAGKEEWLAAKRAEEQQAATEWAEQFDMPPLEGPEKALAWGERSRHQLVTTAYSALVTEGSWDEADWAALEDTIRTVTRVGWWIDQRDAEGTDLPELLDAAASDDIGTENPFR